MTAHPRKSLRCAIYTRKSSEEGLEQDFNSLEAQREACEAYIKSQAHEGWRALPERFDDGGFSGGSLERPALQRLLDEIRDRRIDIIVIYKIDRLTRSLMDFAKLAEVFDKQGVSFVAVTQQFNTTTSMGRLMLNVLLSFAQFEREITGERIRDKIAASKKKGIWMGGNLPTGYDVKERNLVINEAGAETVRTIFRLYIELGTVRKVWAEARRLNLRTTVRLKPDGTLKGGKFFVPGNIYHVLSSPIYIGKLQHKEQIHPGNHPPVIDAKLWDAVQARLATNRVDRRYRRNAKHPSPLAGILFDAKGTRFTPTHTSKDGKRYRYYVDPALTTGVTPAMADLPRIPAIEIEHVVRKGLANFLCDEKSVLAALGSNARGGRAERAVEKARELAENLLDATPMTWMPFVRPMLERIVVRSDAVILSIARSGLRAVLFPAEAVDGAHLVLDADHEHKDRPYEYRLAVKIRTRGGIMKLVVGNGGISNSGPDLALVRTIARAHAWAERLKSGKTNSARDIADDERLTAAYVARVLKLGFLAPVLVDAIIDGRQPPELTADRLLLREEISPIWGEQTDRWAATV